MQNLTGIFNIIMYEHVNIFVWIVLVPQAVLTGLCYCFDVYGLMHAISGGGRGLSAGAEWAM